MAKPSKKDLWLKYFLDDGCPLTFLNRLESARKAKYNAKNDDSLRVQGCKIFRSFAPQIEKWMDEEGLSENVLKLKLLSLMEVKETKFIKIKGYLDPDQPGVRVIGTSGLVEVDAKGKKKFTAGDTLLAIDIAAIETQRRTLDMAIKVKGMNAPTELKHTGGVSVTHICNIDD